ncbi:hypothetical protein [Roseateles chitinivorans]|uniref:hypothetical protein n=1 Tax=Roseateles chitinivorans TaxID=2917965 RepID=UPI003D678471
MTLNTVLRPGWRMAWSLLLLAMLSLAAAATPAGRRWLHRVDSEWLGERVMDTLARVRSREDWAAVVPLLPDQNYAWLRTGAGPVRIAHALGEAGQPTANTLGAMRRSYVAGFRLFEVDLVLEDGELRCQHDPGPQTSMVRDGCSFDTLLAALPSDAFLVLDIKTDFRMAGRRIVDRLKGTPEVQRVVFQLYHPEDFASFSAWQKEVPLPGPILTAYLSHRRVDYLAQQILRLGGAVLTLPLERAPALSVRLDGLSVLLHPVHDASACARALASDAQGVYLLNSVRCPP